MGGSLAGLFQAVALHRRGADVMVWERARRRGDANGAGIVLQDAACAFLQAHCRVDPRSIAVASTCRQQVVSAGQMRAVGGPALATSWSTLHRVLRDTLPDDRYVDDRPVLEVSPTDERSAQVRTAAGCEDVDVVVLADGARSVHRHLVSGGGPPQYVGYVAFRGVVAEAVLGPVLTHRLMERFTSYSGPGTEFVCYGIPGSSYAEGAALHHRALNWVWYEPVPHHLVPELTTDSAGYVHHQAVPPGRCAPEVVAQLTRHAEECLPMVLAEIVRRTARPFLQVITEYRPTAMRSGPVLLTGDAAFTIRPHTGSATSKAAGDAADLYRALSGARSETALRAWEARRMQVGASMLGRSARQAPRLDGATAPGPTHRNPWTGVGRSTSWVRP